jgi:hypothetical protein
MRNPKCFEVRGLCGLTKSLSVLLLLVISSGVQGGILACILINLYRISEVVLLIDNNLALLLLTWILRLRMIFSMTSLSRGGIRQGVVKDCSCGGGLRYVSIR